jgi:hypothetical protein
MAGSNLRQLIEQPHPIGDVGRANGADQGIASFFLEGFEVHGANSQPQAGVFADQGSVGSLADAEQGFSHGWTIPALVTRAI